MITNFFRELSLRRSHRCRIANRDRMRPLGPLQAGVAILERSVDRPIFEPCVVFFESPLGVSIAAAPVRVEVLERSAQQPILEFSHTIEIDVVVGKMRDVSDSGQQPVLDEMLR